MKRIIQYLPFCLFALLPFLTSCGGDDDNSLLAAGQLKVVSADLLFTSRAATHDIEVSSAMPYTASVNKDWCRVTPEGNIVHVEVDRNTELTSRNAIITLESGMKTLCLALSQSGAVWMVRGESSYNTSDEDTTLVIPASLDFDYTVTMPDWMDGEEVEDGYQLHLHENNTGGAREGTFTIKSVMGTKNIKFRQFGMRSVGGTYDITYSYTTGSSTITRTVTRRIEIEADRTKNYLYLRRLCYMDDDDYDDGVELPIPMTMGTDGSLHFSNGHMLDGAKSGYLYLVLHQEGEYQNFIFVGDADYSAPLKLTKQGGISIPSYTFVKKTTSFIDPTGMEAVATADGVYVKTASMPDIRYTQAGETLGLYMNIKLKKIIE